MYYIELILHILFRINVLYKDLYLAAKILLRINMILYNHLLHIHSDTSYVYTWDVRKSEGNSTVMVH